MTAQASGAEVNRNCIFSAQFAISALAVALLAGCQPSPAIRVVECPSIPASLTRDCGRCGPDDPAPATNGELAEAYLDCRQCAAEQRIRLDAVRELADCRSPKSPPK